MTLDENTQDAPELRVGTRTYADVELARKRLESREAEQSLSRQFRSGASAAFSWALGHADHSPVTGVGEGAGPPDIQTLTAEVDAAVVQLEGLPGQPGPKDYCRGVHDALAWVCGHSDTAP